VAVAIAGAVGAVGGDAGGERRLGRPHRRPAGAEGTALGLPPVEVGRPPRGGGDERRHHRRPVWDGKPGRRRHGRGGQGGRSLLGADKKGQAAGRLVEVVGRPVGRVDGAAGAGEIAAAAVCLWRMPRHAAPRRHVGINAAGDAAAAAAAASVTAGTRTSAAPRPPPGAPPSPPPRVPASACKAHQNARSGSPSARAHASATDPPYPFPGPTHTARRRSATSPPTAVGRPNADVTHVTRSRAGPPPSTLPPAAPAAAAAG